MVDDSAEETLEDHEIFNVLGELRLAYERRTSTRGIPYAGFRLVGAPGTAQLAITAIAEHRVLRLTSHDIDTPLGPLDIVKAGARLPLGAAFRSPADGTAQLSVGVWIGDRSLPRELMSRLLTYLAQATEALRRGIAAPQLPYVGDLRTSDAVDIDAALGQYGHRLTHGTDGVGMQVSLAPGLACAIVVREATDGWISTLATYVPEHRVATDDPSVAELQRLQRWATAGRFVLDESLTLRVEVLTPLPRGATAPAVVWTTSQSVALLQTAARYLGFIANKDRRSSP